MAKQRGIHQIKGKVGEMLYYSQKGVAGGLIRGINQGMSARVKTDEAYSNTRLNNAEFKNANSIATAAFRSVPNRKRGMMVNFAVAAMTKVALEAIKEGTGNWGARRPSVELDALICDMLENHAKLGAYNGEYGLLEVQAFDAPGDVEISFDVSAELASSLAADGINALTIVPMKSLAGEIIVDDLPRLFAGSAFGTPFSMTINAGQADSTDIVLSVETPASVGMSQSGYTFAQQDTNHGFWCVIAILPTRREGGNSYVLQEKCTYVALPLGQIPEP